MGAAIGLFAEEAAGEVAVKAGQKGTAIRRVLVPRGRAVPASGASFGDLAPRQRRSATRC